MVAVPEAVDHWMDEVVLGNLLSHLKEGTEPHTLYMNGKDLECVFKIHHHLTSLEDVGFGIPFPVYHIQLLHPLRQGNN